MLAILIALTVCWAPDTGAQAQDASEAWSLWPGRTVIPASTETLEDVARLLAQRVPRAGRIALAIATTEAGHWRIMNAAGEPFTAASPAELEAGLRALAPQSLGTFDAVDFVLPPTSVFEKTNVLAILPEKAALHLADGTTVRRIWRTENDGAARWRIEIGDGLLLDIGRRDAFEEVLRVLARPIARETIRVLSIAHGGPTTVASRPTVDVSRRIAQPDAIDPEHLGAAFAKLSGQTVLIAGRVQNDRLAYADMNGREGTLALAALEALAVARDVDLVILSTTSGRQPGTRNRLYQQVALGGFDKAVDGGTLRHVLRMIGGEPPALGVTAEQAGPHRLHLRFSPETTSGNAAGGWSRTISGAIGDLLPETTGTLTVVEMRAWLLGSRRHGELAWRFVPHIPITWQWALLAAALAGLACLKTAWRWWEGVWPPEARAEYGSRLAHFLAQTIRALIFIVLFLPFAGIPAIAWRLAAFARRRRGGAAP